MIMRALATAIVATTAITGAAPSAFALASSEDATAAADARFKALSEAEYAWRKTLWPSDENTPKNERRGLPDVGPEMQAVKLARWTETAAALDAIDPAGLSSRVRTDYLVYKAQIDALLEEQRYREYEKPLNADSSFWGDVAGAGRESYRTADDYRHYLRILGEVPRYFDQQIANMRAGLKRGFTPPRITLEGRDIGVAEVVKAGGTEASPFYASFKTMPATIPATTQAELRVEARRVIAAAVVPAHAKLLAFLREEYVPGARTTLAAYAFPDGDAYYRSKIREFVTRDMSADEVHAIGLSEVAKIKARMHAVMRELKYEGDLAAFLAFLRTDPRFYAKTPQELLDRAAWIAKTFDGKADDWFGRLPRARFAIKPVPDDLAPFYTSGRGGPGIYLVNTYNLPARPLYSLAALTLHESAPGHALQMSLAAELEDLPAYRRETYISAYGEGWALYSEALGEDMGMYETPYDRFGMLSYQMWRAARLVVDTGLHAKGWTREQAQAFLRDNTALSNHEVTTEVDRYIAWPGQALSYYMGELAFLAGRARAEKALGARFDIRAFHDAMLALGSVPLPLVDARVDQFIAEGGKGPYPLK